MKIINFLIPVFLFFTFISFSDSNQKHLRVTYQVDIVKNPNSKLDEMLENISEDAFGKKIASFTLLVGNNESSFILNKATFHDKNVLDIFNIKTGYKGPTVKRNDSLLTFMKKGILQKPYILNSSFHNFKITKDRKVINGYNCFKAKAINKVENSAGTFNHEIVVWFTPELPFKSGPLTFTGVDGLVLEAHTKDCVFYASKIEFIDKAEIYKLPKVKIISEKQFAQML